MPQNWITVGFDRGTGIAPFAVAGTAYTGRTAAPTGTNGFYTGSIELPAGVDPSYPSNVVAVIAAGAVATFTAAAVVLQLRTTMIAPDGTLSELPTVTNVVPVPDNWPLNQPLILAFNNGNGRTFNAADFVARATIGFLFTRNGLDVNDTYPVAMFFGTLLTLEYHQRCQLVCCP